MILIRCMRNSFEGDLYSSDCLMWIFWKRSSNLLKYTANLPNRPFVKKTIPKIVIVYTENMTRKVVLWCFFMSKKRSTVQHFAPKIFFFFKWDRKVTKIRQIIFHRIWKNMYTFCFQDHHMGGFQNMIEKNSILCTLCMNGSISVEISGRKNQDSFIYWCWNTIGHPHYWTKNV